MEIQVRLVRQQLRLESMPPDALEGQFHEDAAGQDGDEPVFYLTL